MLKVTPSRVEMAEGNRATRLVLSSDSNEQAYHLDMPLAAGQKLALEMKGLAADRCGEHHIVPAIALAAGLRLGSLVLTMLDSGWMSADLVLERDGHSDWMGPVRVRSDVAAALALAIHINLPVFVEERAGEAGMEHMHETVRGRAAPPAEVPAAFQELIRSLDWPEQG